MFVVWVVERLVMMSPPGFEVVCAADVLLHLLLPIYLGLHHLRLVDDVGCQAFALEWAAASFLHLLLGAVTRCGRRLLLDRDGWLDVGQDLSIVGGDDLLHVGAGRVGELEVRPVEGLAQWAVLGEALGDQGKESGANAGLDVHGVRGIPPDDLSFPPPIYNIYI